MSAELRIPLSRRPGLFRWAVGLLVFSSVLVTAESADATCGDYLRGFNHTSAVAEHRNEENLPVHDLPSKSPSCDGPFCRQVPLAPIDRPQPEMRTSEVKELHSSEKTPLVMTDEWSYLTQVREILPNPPDLERLDRPPRPV